MEKSIRQSQRLSLLKRVLFYATFFRLYGSTCHQPLKKLNRILFHWCHQKEVDDTNMEDASATSYPRLQVDDGEDECYDDDYPYHTDDSNAEDNPLFDYPGAIGGRG